MKKYHFQRQQLKSLVEKISSKQVTGTLIIRLQTKEELNQKKYILVLNNGKIAYGGSYIPKRNDFVKTLAHKVDGVTRMLLKNKLKFENTSN